MKFIIFFLSPILTASQFHAQTRVVLLEQFTNAGCPPCAPASPLVYNFVNSNLTDIVAIAYHTSFPYSNSMYTENTTESNARVSLYSIPSVPYTIIDGNVYSNTSSNFNLSNTTILNNRKAVSSKYIIQKNSLLLSGNQLTGSFQFNSINANNTSDDLVAHVVVIEKNVLKNYYAASPGANSETEYGYVMRKMLPIATGTSLVNKAMGLNDVVSINWTLSKIKNSNELRVVAFVQNTTTKEVYQAVLFSPSLATNIEVNSAIENQSFTVYPNPSSNNFNISFSENTFIEKITISNLLAETVLQETINSNVSVHSINNPLTTGIYIVTINSNNSI